MTSDEAIHNSTKTTIEGKIIPIGFWNIFFFNCKEVFSLFYTTLRSKKKNSLKKKKFQFQIQISFKFTHKVSYKKRLLLVIQYFTLNRVYIHSQFLKLSLLMPIKFFTLFLQLIQWWLHFLLFIIVVMRRST